MLVDGREIAEGILKNLESKSSNKKICFLSFNETPASKSFVGIKTRVAQRLGVSFEVVNSQVESTKDAVDMIRDISGKGFDGLVVQLPLGESLDTEVVLDAIPLQLDVDILGKEAKQIYKSGKSDRIPPVAGAVKKILDQYKIDLNDKNVIILGQGRLVGQPVSMYFDQIGQIYTVLDKFTPDEELFKNIKEADVLISGIGVPHFIKPSMIKDGVVLIDAGTSSESGKLVGDIDPFCEVKSSLLTPVPGGVGPITVAVLFSNLYSELP